MTSRSTMTRREFARLAAAGVLAPDLARSLQAVPHPTERPVNVVTRAGSSSPEGAWPGYGAATVIDLLASVTPFNVPDMYARPLSPAMVENARKSGITAVNATCSASGVGAASFIETVTNIAYWEREFDAHPDVLVKVKTVAALREAKRSGRVGVIL